MARAVGIDVRPTHVRAALVTTSYRKVVVERMLEVETAYAGSVEQALALCVSTLATHGEPLAVAVDGERALVHRVALPPTAQKQLAEVLAYEIESQVPVDIDELTYDFRRLPRAASTDPIVVLVGAARTEQVRSRIALVQGVLGREPERVGCGPLPLANLALVCPELERAEPVAIVDLGGSRTEVVVLHAGNPVFARTLTRGVDGLPETAPALAAELRQTLVGCSTQLGVAVESAMLVGAGASAPGAEGYLGRELGMPVSALPPLRFDGLLPEQAEVVPRFAKALGLALGLALRARDPDLRQGELAFQRGFGFVKEKAPILSGLLAAILVSFLFSTWAELRSLEQEHGTLTTALAALSQEALGEATTDPARVGELIDKAKGGDDSDPMPHMDAFDIVVELAKGIPMNVTHDIEDFDMQRNHVRLVGIVQSAADVQTVASAMKGTRCVQDVKIGKITQVVNSEKQKYTLEFDVRCPEDTKAVPKKKKADEPAEPGATP